MKRLFGILLWALFCLFGTQLSFGQNNREQVLALQRQAIELMDNGDPDQGIVLLPAGTDTRSGLLAFDLRDGLRLYGQTGLSESDQTRQNTL